MQKPFERRLRLNNQIRVPQVQVIGPEGEKLGILPMHEALRIAGERNLDVVEVGPQATPPLVKILDYGKFQYQKERKDKQGGRKAPGQEVKTVRIGFRTGPHDLGIRAGQIDKFLAKGYRVKVEMKLRGREKGMAVLGKTNMEQFFKFITEPFEMDGPIKGFPGGLGTLVRPVKK
ncbi:MAG TPA: translation initiation factor IF-3 [Candidatus Paceibacterota bacterium]